METESDETNVSGFVSVCVNITGEEIVVSDTHCLQVWWKQTPAAGCTETLSGPLVPDSWTRTALHVPERKPTIFAIHETNEMLSNAIMN